MTSRNDVIDAYIGTRIMPAAGQMPTCSSYRTSISAGGGEVRRSLRLTTEKSIDSHLDTYRLPQRERPATPGSPARAVAEVPWESRPTRPASRVRGFSAGSRIQQGTDASMGTRCRARPTASLITSRNRAPSCRCRVCRARWKPC